MLLFTHWIGRNPKIHETILLMKWWRNRHSLLLGTQKDNALFEEDL